MDVSASSPFSRAFDFASDQTGRRFQNPFYFITELFNGSQFRSSLAEVKKFGQQIVSKAQQRRKTRQQEPPNSSSDPYFGSLLDSLMDVFDEDPTLTADAALNFLSAGRDTTAQALTWTFYSLMRHPTALITLCEELDSLFPPQLHAPHRSPVRLSVASLQPANLPHTMCIFNESLRLYPPVPIEIKQCQTDITLPDGTFLPSGSVLVWCIWAMNRASEFWGHDSDEFRPERWLANSNDDTESPLPDEKSESGGTGGGLAKVKLLSKTAFEFPVFNGGPRTCLGKKMAELMACWILVQVFREFEFEEVVEENEEGKRQERRSQNSLTLPMDGGLPCLVRLREKPSCGTTR